MMTIKSIMKETENCISSLVEEGISHHHLFPHRKDKEVIPLGGNHCIKKFSSIIEYNAIYKDIICNKQYELILFDGSIISFSYKFETESTIREMRFEYFPRIDIFPFEQLDVELLEDEREFMAEIEFPFFCFPMRIDYKNPDFCPRNDPFCHLHFGLKKESRLPIYASIAPKAIIAFVLESIYPKRFDAISNKAFWNYSSNPIIPQIRDSDKLKYHLRMESN